MLTLYKGSSTSEFSRYNYYYLPLTPLVPLAAFLCNSILPLFSYQIFTYHSGINWITSGKLSWIFKSMSTATTNATSAANTNRRFKRSLKDLKPTVDGSLMAHQETHTHILRYIKLLFEDLQVTVFIIFL